MDIQNCENLKEVMREAPECLALSQWERGFADGNKCKNYLSEKQLLIYAKIIHKMEGRELTTDVLDMALSEIDAVIEGEHVPQDSEPEEDGWICAACYARIAPMQAHIIAPQDGKMVHVHIGECADTHASAHGLGGNEPPMPDTFDDDMPF